MINKTLDYYNTNSSEYIFNTINSDLTDLYKLFFNYIPSNGSILDLGCGSGRDSKFFISKGYEVTAVDGSSEFCRKATEYLGQEVICKTFAKIDYVQEFDAVWACASLLHVPKKELVRVFENIGRALKDGGYVYCSFKYGDFDGFRNGRQFTYLDEISFGEIIDEVSSLKTVETTVSGDVRAGREEEMWLNAILIKDV